MQRTPPKRRKVSPTKSVPVEDAPTPRTPSRIPGPARDAAKTPSERRPSFASPTKASIARHNPQLLNRPSSSGSGAEGKGKNLDDVFAKALGEVRDTVESQPGSIDGGTQSSGSPRHGSRVPETQRSTTPRVRRLSVGGPLSAKPKRLSRSPVKRPERTVPPDTGFGELQEDVNPFRKRGGLRRSPISPSQAEPELVVEDNLPGVANPFKKTGLRRSPISSQPARSFEEAIAQPEVSTTPTAPTPVPAAETIIFDDIQNQEGLAAMAPIPAEEPVIQSEKPNVLNDADEEPVFPAEESISLNNALEEPIPQAEEPIIVNAPQIEEPPVAPKSAPKRRASHLAELIRDGKTSEEAASEDFSTTRPREEAVPTPVQASKPLLSPENDFPPSYEPAQPVPASISPVPQLEEILKEIPRPSRPQRPEAVFKFGISPVKESLRSAKPQQPERQEPELPPTPTQRGIADPIVTTPPSGIHDTPSKRGRRSKALGEKLKSSPLKPRPALPQEPAKEAEKPQEPEAEAEVEIQVNFKPEKEKPKRRKSARFLVPEDPHASKKKARDDLLKELQQLQADVALTNQENERLRLHQESGKRRPTAAPNPDELLALLKRSTEQPSKPKPKPTSIFKSIGSFLPFSSRRRAQPISSALEKPLPSHLPIALDDPLPYLEAFSPLNYTSTIVLLPSDQSSSASTSGESQPTLQKHNIHATHQTGLFAARLTMTVNTSNLSITFLSIPALDTNAEKELGPFIRDRAAGTGNDISVVCWAMGRWVEVSIKRAAFFCTVGNEFGTAEARVKSRSRSRKRKRHHGVEEDGDGDVEEEDELKGRKWTRRQLLPHMGRTSMEIVNEEVELRIEWKIGFDWTGEAESAVKAGARVSKSWQKADDRKVLDKVPETFDKLVKERGPLGAVRSIVGLLMDGS